MFGNTPEIILKPRATKFIQESRLLNLRQFHFKVEISTIDAVTTLVADTALVSKKATAQFQLYMTSARPLTV